MMSRKVLAGFVLACLILGMIPISVATEEDTYKPMSLHFPDSSELKVYPQIGTLRNAMVTEISSNEYKYGFEDYNDYDWNDVVIRVKILEEDTDPVIFRVYLDEVNTMGVRELQIFLEAASEVAQVKLEYDEGTINTYEMPSEGLTLSLYRNLHGEGRRPNRYADVSIYKTVEEQNAPQAIRVFPSSSTVPLTAGEQQTFKIKATDEDGDLNMVQWEVNGKLQKTDSLATLNEPDFVGSADFSYSFEDDSIVEAIVYDNKMNEDRVTWNVWMGEAPTIISFTEIIKPGVFFEGTFNEYNYGRYPMIMEITALDGLEFNGILHWPELGDSKTKFRGKIDPSSNQIWFTEYEQIQGSSTIVLNGDYYAEIEDNSLSGYWNWPSGAKGGVFSIALTSTVSPTPTMAPTPTPSPSPTSTGVPRIMHDPNWVVGYYNIPLSICVGLKDDICIKRCSLYYKIGELSNYEHVEMIEHSNVVHEGHTLYEATIPASDVTLKELEYYFEAENIEGCITKTIAYHPHLEFLELYDSYPALNREGYPYEVKLLKRVPKLLGIIGSGMDTSFEGNEVPGYLWVPVELSDDGLYTMIDQYPFWFKDYKARKATYKEVLLHMLLQDDFGLAADFDDFMERLSADTETMATFGEVGGGTGRDIANNLIESLKQGNTKLSRDELLFLSRHLHSPNNYAGVSKRLADLLDDIESKNVVRKVSIVSLSSKITGDAIKTLRYWCAAQEATSRIEAFKKTNYYNKNPNIDPALRDAIEEVLKEIEQMQDNSDIVRAFQTAADKAIDVTDYIVNAGTIVTSLGGQVPSWLTPYLIGGKLIWEDVFKEADTLKLMIAAATLEKSFHENAITVVKDKNDVYLLLQMKYYLGYYYANLFLSLKGKWTISAADFVGSCFLGREKMSERFDQLEVTKKYCIKKYREFEVTTMPTTTPTPTTPPDINKYSPKIYLDNNEKWKLSEVYYYGPLYGYDEYAGKECYCIEYWFKFNGDGNERGDDWEPVYVFIDLNGNVLYCAATYHYRWDSKDTEADDFENNHVKVYFARDYHTPIIDYGDASGLRTGYLYWDGDPSAYFKEYSYTTPSHLAYMKYPHDTEHPFSQERGDFLEKNDFDILLKPDKTTYRRGETAQVTIDVTNNRDQDTEIWLGTTFKYPTLKDPEDIPLKRAVIPKGETESFDIAWTIPADAPLGQYEIAVNCWKDAGQNEYYTDNIVWAPIFNVDMITPVLDVPPEQKARENVEDALGALASMAEAYYGFMELIYELSEVEPPEGSEVEFNYHVLSSMFCNNIAEAQTYMSSSGIESADMNDALELVRELELAKEGFCIVIVDYSFMGFGEYESGTYPIVCNEKGDPFWESWQFYEMIKEEIEVGYKEYEG